MKTVITDLSALEAITPAALATFAKQNGWQKQEAYGEHGSIFAGKNLPEILVPNTTSISDYIRAVARLLEIFSVTSEKTQLALYRDLITSDNDVIRIRANGDTDDGSIKIDDGVSLIKHSQSLLLSAACAVSSPRPVYRTGANREANDYMQNVRLGQTEHGSFVVIMLATIPPSVHFDLFGNSESSEPIERRVSETLINALDAAKSITIAAHSGDDIFLDQTLVERGLSANFCDALSGLIESGRLVQIGLSWAKTRPREGRPRKYEFSESDGDILRESARMMREKTPYENYELIGFVHRLTRSEGQEAGTISVKGFIEGSPTSVSIQLEKEAYSLATGAHRDRRTVKVEGDLSQQGQRWRMTDARISIISDDE